MINSDFNMADKSGATTQIKNFEDEFKVRQDGSQDFGTDQSAPTKNSTEIDRPLFMNINAPSFQPSLPKPQVQHNSSSLMTID